MSEDLFAWADRNRRNAARREKRRLQRLAVQCSTAEIIDFPDRRWQRIDRLLDSALAAHKRSEQRAAGALPPAPILPFHREKRQA